MRVAAIKSPVSFGLGMLVVTAALALSPAHAQMRPNYELTGVVAVGVWAASDGDDRSNRVCGSDPRDVARRALFILGQTRLVGLSDPLGRHWAIEAHPTYGRLKAGQREAAELRRQAGTPAARDLAQAGEDAANRALFPWEFPPLMMISTLPAVAAPGVCAEVIRTEVTSRVVATRLRGSRANTEGPVNLFAASTLITGPASTSRERRGRIVEEHVRDFVNAWVEVNREQ